MYSDESADVDAGSYYVVFQYCEGAAVTPVVIKADVNEKKKTVKFVFPKGAPWSGEFYGVFKKGGIKVSIKGTGIQNEWLKKQPSYWEHGRDCK